MQTNLDNLPLVPAMLSLSLNKREQKNEIKNIPVDVILEIFSYLSSQDLDRIGLVDKYWYNLNNNDNFCRLRYKMGFCFSNLKNYYRVEPEVNLLRPFKKTWKETYEAHATTRFKIAFMIPSSGFAVELQQWQGKFKVSDGGLYGRGVRISFNNVFFHEGKLYDGNIKVSLIAEGKFQNSALKQGKRSWDSEKGFVVEEGEFKSGRLNGRGAITRGDGTAIEGEFQNGQLNGQGKEILDDGIVLEGEFKKGRLNGEGQITVKGVVVKKGLFKDNMLNGQGKEDINGIVAEGEFHKDILVQGKITYPDGIVKQGIFQNNQVIKVNRLIKGKMIYPDGVIKEGSFIGNKERLVQGKITYPNGLIKDGDFQGATSEQKNMIYSNGVVKDFTYINENLTQGKMIYPQGIIKEGKFQKDKLQGQGRISYSNMEFKKIEGEFKNDELNGYGELTYSNGRVRKGRFKDNKLIQWLS